MSDEPARRRGRSLVHDSTPAAANSRSSRRDAALHILHLPCGFARGRANDAEIRLSTWNRRVFLSPRGGGRFEKRGDCGWPGAMILRTFRTFRTFAGGGARARRRRLAKVVAATQALKKAAPSGRRRRRAALCSVMPTRRAAVPLCPVAASTATNRRCRASVQPSWRTRSFTGVKWREEAGSWVAASSLRSMSSS